MKTRKTLVCEDCCWIGSDQHTQLRRQRSLISEHCPCCGSEHLLESSPVDFERDEDLAA